MMIKKIHILNLLIVLCFLLILLTGCISIEYDGDRTSGGTDIAPYFFLNGDRFTASINPNQPGYVSSLPEGDFETTRITYVNWWECSDDGTGNVEGVVYWDPSNPDEAYFYDDVWAENGTEQYQYFSCNWEEG